MPLFDVTGIDDGRRMEENMSKQAELRGHLMYIELGSPDPKRLAAFYASIFNMRAERSLEGWICRGPNRCLLVSDGLPGTLLSAGYAAPDRVAVERLETRAAANLVPVEETGAQLFQPGALAFRDPDGNRIMYGVAASTGDALEADAMPARLQHLVVGSSNAASLVGFYTDIIGFRKSDEVRDDQGALRSCFLRSDHEHHSFAVFQTSANSLDHHCYELPDWNDIRDWGDRLAKHGVPVKWGPGRHGPGNNLFLFFHDPDGNWVELSTELEIVSDKRPSGAWRHEERTLNSWGHAYLRS
jgi:catechol 2,3-dioxygenase